MRKIPTMFKRDPTLMSRVLDECTPGCEWVFDGEGVATRKYDGTCVKIDDRSYLKRREIKRGRPEPDGFIFEDYDENTGKTVGWVPVDPYDKGDRYHIEALSGDSGPYPNGTYELCGPKVQKNPEGYSEHILVSHDRAEVLDAPRGYDAIRDFMEDKDIEGIVFHHPDGRMAKIKKRDYGQKRVTEKAS